MYKLLISSLIALLLFIGSGAYPVMADGPTYTINSPDSSIELGEFSEATSYASTGITISASTTDISSLVVTVAVADAKTNNPGYLTLDGADSSGATKLTNPLQVEGGANQPTYTNLLGSSGVTLSTDAILSSGNYSFSNFAINQTIEDDDLAKTAGSYSLIMTFTATFN